MSQQNDDEQVPAYEAPDVQRPASAAPTEQQLEREAFGALPRHDPYAALRFRNYRLYSIGWLAALIGQQVQGVAIGWELYSRTGNAMSLGWVGLVQALPVILLALPAGQLADRHDRKAILIGGTLLAAAAALSLGLLSYVQGPIWLMYVLLGLGATASAMSWPARSSFLPQMVPPQAFSNAVTWNSSFFQVACVLGPALGGAIVVFSTAAAYLTYALGAAVFVLCLLLVQVRSLPRETQPANLATLLAGLRFVFNTKIILATITLDLFAVLLGGAEYLLPIFAQEILDVGSVGFGWLRAAPAIGAFVTALLVAHLPPMKKAGRAMLWAVAGFGAAMIVFGLSRNYWLSLVMLALTGAFDNISVVVRHTLVQVLTPDSMRGRVSAVNNVFIGASNELGGFESGLTAAWFGPVISVVGGGIGTIVVVLGVLFSWPQVKRFGSLHDAKPARES